MLSILRQVTEDGCTICSPAGELEAYTVGQFRETLAEVAANASLLIDMSGVTFVDSAGLGALIGGIRRTRELGGEVVVSCTKPAILKLLRSTGFDRIVFVTETVEAGLDYLRRVDLSGDESEPVPISRGPQSRALRW
ncbi:MAG TPA: STAS domain-containing protein [Acidimicrobiales bacterium]|nr:STAS domain-containing protein [Acidimicrobiales bacterium]